MKKLLGIIMLIFSISMVSCSVSRETEKTIVLEGNVETGDSNYTISIENLELEEKGFTAFEFKDNKVYGMMNPSEKMMMEFETDNNIYELLENNKVVKNEVTINRELSEYTSVVNPTYSFYNEGMKNSITGEKIELVSIKDRVIDLGVKEEAVKGWVENSDVSNWDNISFYDKFVVGNDYYIELETYNRVKNEYQIIIYDLKLNSIYKSEVMSIENSNIAGIFYNKELDSLFLAKDDGEILKVILEGGKIKTSNYSKVKLEKDKKIRNIIMTSDTEVYFEVWIEDGTSNPVFLNQIIKYDMVSKKGNKIYDINKDCYFISYVSRKICYLVTVTENDSNSLYTIENGKMKFVGELPSSNEELFVRNEVVPNEDGSKLFLTTYNQDRITGKTETKHSIYSIKKR